jgi:CDP-diglyceride synthetase
MEFPEPLPAAEPKKSRTGLIIGVVIAILCCCCLIGSGLGYYLYQNGDQIFGTGVLVPIFAAL